MISSAMSIVPFAAFVCLPRRATAKRGRSCEAGEGALESQHQVPPPVLRTTSPAQCMRGGGKAQGERMTLEPLIHAPPAVQIHAATVIPAFFLGTWQIFLSRKGARPHRAVGYVYLALMAVTAVAALFIHSIMPNSPFFGLSPIHVFVPITLFGVASALYGAWTHNIRVHRNAMLGTYIGGLLIAGTLAFMPGRIMHSVTFGKPAATAERPEQESIR
jgi:uncharacterized membrane protein